MKINDLVFMLITGTLVTLYFVVLPLGPMWLRIPIDVLVGVFIVVEGIVACVKHGHFVGYIVGIILGLFILGKCVEYGVIPPL